MGSPKADPGRTDVESEAEAKLTEGFYLAQHEVTQAEWTAVMKTSLEKQLESLTDAEARGTGEEFPMYAVSYDECQRFCERLTELDHASGQLPETWAYVLPTETQWEYACRAGTTTATAFGEALSSTLANFDGEFPYNGAPEGPNLKATCAVGSYPPNNWGLCDMHGNVREWCRDAFTDIVLGGTDPQSSDGEAGRVVRGGSWLSLGLGCRSADRTRVESTHRDKTLGFRVAVVRVTP
jgi:formylglycine-generating enzyme required for sulfatase activity